MTPQELVALAYRYYPRGLKSYDPAYASSPEHRRLIAARLHFGQGEARAPWDALVKRLATRLPACAIADSTHLHPQNLDACYRVRVDRTPHDRRVQRELVAWVSIIAPYYAVYSSEGEAGIGKGPPRIRFTFTPEEQPILDVVVAEIESAFGYERLPHEVGTIVIPDIVSGNEQMGTNTLYDCLFTDNLW